MKRLSKKQKEVLSRVFQAVMEDFQDVQFVPEDLFFFLLEDECPGLVDESDIIKECKLSGALVVEVNNINYIFPSELNLGKDQAIKMVKSYLGKKDFS